MANDIPALSKSQLGDNARPVERIREELQILLGLRGDPMDQALTLRQAVARGLIDSAGRALTGSVSVTNYYPIGAGGEGGSPEVDLTPPPTPTGLVVQAGFTQVLVQWDAPTYTQGHGNQQTNVYAVKKATSDASLPTFEAGVTPRVYVAPGALNIISMPSELNTRWHIWIKFETVDGVESATPAGGTNGYNLAGVYPTTGQDISQLLQVLTGQITESQLYGALGTRINLIDAADTVAGSVAARVKAERDLRVSADAATLSSANVYTGNYAYPKATGEQVALDLLTLNALVVNPATGLPATRAKLINEYATIAGPTNSLASVTTSLQAFANSAAGTAQTNAQNYTTSFAYAKVDGEALAETVSTLSAVARATVLSLPFDAWTLNGQSLETVSDGKVGSRVLRLAVLVGGNPNQGSLIPLDRTKQYRVRFWARPTSNCNGLLLFSLRQYVSATTTGPVNVGRAPYKPSEQTRAGHNAQFGVDQWGEYSYLWGPSDWQAGVQFVLPEFLSNLTGTAGWWEVQDFRMEEVTAFESLTATVTDISTVQASGTIGNAALAGRTTTLEARVNSPSGTAGPNYNPTYAALQTEQSVRAALDGAVQALYTVRTEVSSGGRTVVGGFGLSATATASAGPRIDFGVRADQFYVAAPSGAGVADRFPFVIRTSATTENGVSIPAGVFMDAAYIVNLSAMWARFGSLIADSIAAGQISAANLTLGTGTVGGDLKSTSFTTGSGVTAGTGWKLTPGGTLYASGAVIYGTVYAYAGVIGGIELQSNNIRSNYVAGTTGFTLKADGSAEFNNVTVRGAVYADTGTFAGALSGATGTFAGALSAATGTLGTLTIAAGGYIRAGQTAYNTGIGFYSGIDSGVPRFSIGNPAGAHMKWDGTDLTINTPTFDSFTASIAGGNISASVSYGTQSYGSRTASASGGLAPYSYRWIASYGGHTGTAVNEGQVWISSGGGSATASFAGRGGDMTIAATFICIVTDANGRVATASIASSVTHDAFPPGGE